MTVEKTSIIDSHPYLRQHRDWICRRSVGIPHGQTLDLISDKWVVAVLYVLSSGTKRYGELKGEIGSISQRMLTRTLRDLERNGLVNRQVYPVVPLMVEYSLTPLGKTLTEVLKNLCNWAIDNFQQVEVARNDYDDANERS